MIAVTTIKPTEKNWAGYLKFIASDLESKDESAVKFAALCVEFALLEERERITKALQYLDAVGDDALDELLDYLFRTTPAQDGDKTEKP